MSGPNTTDEGSTKEEANTDKFTGTIVEERDGLTLMNSDGESMEVVGAVKSITEADTTKLGRKLRVEGQTTEQPPNGRMEAETIIDLTAKREEERAETGPNKCAECGEECKTVNLVSIIDTKEVRSGPRARPTGEYQRVSEEVFSYRLPLCESCRDEQLQIIVTPFLRDQYPIRIEMLMRVALYYPNRPGEARA
ncbi:hypothetical protein [Halorussus salinus]|uniref:hypothetical protein n=1 Tax=Halorussus salinus TaxID=1364935 RepID=UPI0010923A6C|nr:hypothetical protein [Halorussus salinus]